MRRLGRFFFCLTLAAFALRVFRLEAQSLWYDEAFSVYLAHFDLATITVRTAADIQPPLYYYLLHFWITLAGDSEFALRFLSLCFGVLTVPLVFVTAQRLFNRQVARNAAILATLSPLYVWYAQEARMYTLITLLLLLSSYALWRAQTNGRWWSVFICANIAALYTHYFALVVMAFQLLFALYRFRLRWQTSPVLLSTLAIGAAFLPWTPFVIARLGQDVSYWRGALKLEQALRHILINLTMGESVLESQAQWIAAGWLGVLLIGLMFTLRHAQSQSSYPALTFAILYLLVPLGLLLILFSRNPKFNARYLMIASPAFLVLLAAGLASISRISHPAMRHSLFTLTFTFLLSTSAFSLFNAYFDPAFTKADFRGVAHYLEKNIAPGEVIILTSGHLFPAFNYYYRGTAPQLRLPDDPTLNTEHVLGYETVRVLNQTIAGKPGVWVVLWQNEVVDPNDFLPTLLSACGQEQNVNASFWHVRVRHWTLNPQARCPTEPNPQVKRVVNFKNKMQLLGYDVTPTPSDVGASVMLYWQALDQLDDDYLVALRVRDGAGNVWGKLDRRPAGYNYPTQRWKKDEALVSPYSVPLLPGTPPGEYWLEVTVYTINDPRGLDVLAPNGAPLGKSAKLGPIPVLPATQPANIAALNIPNVLHQSFGPVTLLGYQLGRDRASAGETIPLTLFWRADQKPSRDYTFKMQFSDVTTDAFPLANPSFPTSAWRAGEIVRGQYAITLPASIKDGATPVRLVLSDGTVIALTSVTIEKTDRVFVKPSASFAQTANFGDVIALVGYDLSATTLAPGSSLKIVLYWQARAKMDKAYTVFVHLLDQNNQVIAQQDSPPLNGARPTPGWIAHEYIADPYELRVAAPPGTYQIEIGWYDADFVRLPVLDENGVPISDHLILKTLLVVR